jgi:hypothetical protein
MVDFQTYRQLHSDTFAFKREYDDHTRDPSTSKMDTITMESDDPPTSPEIYVFPRNIIGYNLRSKKWGKDTILFIFPENLYSNLVSGS